jgi:hypothetical protein
MPAHSETAGSIILEECYALGKMMDSSAWRVVLRRKITPSDIDLCFDNNGAIIFADFSASYTDWNQIGEKLKGQRWLYESVIKHNRHCAVLCKHSVTPELGRKINTLSDVDSFQVMVWDNDKRAFVLSRIYPGRWWQDFVQMWMDSDDGIMKIRRSILREQT